MVSLVDDVENSLRDVTAGARMADVDSRRESDLVLAKTELLQGFARLQQSRFLKQKDINQNIPSSHEQAPLEGIYMYM